MTKQEFIKDLQNRFYKVAFPKQAEDSNEGYIIRLKEGVLWYLIGVYEMKDNFLIRRNISFYCEITGKLLKEQKGILKWEDLPEGNYFYGEKQPEKVVDKFEGVTGIIERTNEYVITKEFEIENGFAVEKRYLINDKGKTEIKC